MKTKCPYCPATFDEYERYDLASHIAEAHNATLAQLVINWTVSRPGITAALCGAKRPGQIRETAGAAGWRLLEAELAAIDGALSDRGEPITKSPA